MVVVLGESFESILVYINFLHLDIGRRQSMTNIDLATSRSSTTAIHDQLRSFFFMLQGSSSNAYQPS